MARSKGVFYESILGMGPSSSYSVPMKKRKQSSIIPLESDDDDDATIIIGHEPNKELECTFVYEPNSEYEWETQTVGKNIEVSLLQSGKDILIKKNMKICEKKTLKLSIEERIYLMKRKQKIMEVCKTVEQSDGDRNAKLDFGKEKVFSLKILRIQSSR